MKLEIIRRYYTEKTTIGDLYIDGKFYCNTLEDKTRAPWETKVWGETAIPAGTYPTIVTYSPHFKQQMAELLDVPGYSKVRLHFGNRPEDSAGCFLVGTYNPKQPDWIADSRNTYATVWAVISRAFLEKKSIQTIVSDTKEFPAKPKITKK